MIILEYVYTITNSVKHFVCTFMLRKLIFVFFSILIEKANAICNIGNLIFSNIISWQWEKQNIVLKRIWARGTTHSDESAFDLLLFMWNLVRVRDVRDLKWAH